MAVKIRFKRMGAKKNPFYRIVVADSRSPRDGRFIEELGYYNPMNKELKLDNDKAAEWALSPRIPFARCSRKTARFSKPGRKRL